MRRKVLGMGLAKLARQSEPSIGRAPQEVAKTAGNWPDVSKRYIRSQANQIRSDFPGERRRRALKGPNF